MELGFCFAGRDVNTFGLVLDIFGVIGLFRYGLPNETLGMVTFGMPKGFDEKLRWRSRVSLALILSGFGLQIAGNYVPPDFLCY